MKPFTHDYASQRSLGYVVLAPGLTAVGKSIYFSAAEVVGAVKGGHAWIAESSTVGLAFEATLGDRTVSCGDHLGAAPEDLVTVRLTASGVPGSLARILGPVGTLAFAVADETGHPAEVEVPAGSATFVRAEIGRPDDAVVSPVDDTPIAQMAALTNPIFLGVVG